MIELLYFAWVRECIGVDGEVLPLPVDVVTVAALLDWLSQRSEGHAAALVDRGAIRVAVDQAFAGPDTPIAAGCEVAIFPPVTGG